MRVMVTFADQLAIIAAEFEGRLIVAFPHLLSDNWLDLQINVVNGTLFDSLFLFFVGDKLCSSAQIEPF